MAEQKNNNVDCDDKQVKKKRSRVNDAEVRKVPVPPHRYTPLKANWSKIVLPVVKQLHLQIRLTAILFQRFSLSSQSHTLTVLTCSQQLDMHDCGGLS